MIFQAARAASISASVTWVAGADHQGLVNRPTDLDELFGR